MTSTPTLQAAPRRRRTKSPASEREFLSAKATATSVSLTGLAHVFADGTGLHPVDLEIAAGEFISILGPSGCGKSTLLRSIAGLDTPDSGTIRFGDRVVFDSVTGVALTPRRRRIGMVFQDLALWPHLSAFENVAFPLRVTRTARAEISELVMSALDLVGLAASAAKLPHQLSGGQQQRIAIARAIVAGPDVLLMDEPLSALDAALRSQLRVELRELTTRLGLTTVYVTHDQTEAMTMSDRVVVLREGRIRQASTPEELYSHPADAFVAGFVGVFNRMPGNDDTGVRPERVTIADAATPLSAGEREFIGTVASCSYLGGEYALLCSIEGVDGDWTVRSQSRHPVGGRAVLRVATEDIISAAPGSSS